MSSGQSLGNGRFYDQERSPPTREGEWENFERDTFKRREGSVERPESGAENEFQSGSPVRRSRSPRSPDRKQQRDGGRDARRYTPYSKDGRDRGRSDRAGRRVASRDCRVYVTNIPYELKWQDLKDIMRKAGDVMYVEMILDNQGLSRGNAVVEFSQAADAERAIKEIDDHEVLGRRLKLREDKVDDDHYQRQLRQQKESEQSRKSQAVQMNSMAGMNMLGGASSNPSMSFLTSRSSDSINATVFVSNLDYKISWQKVKDTFRRAGNVTRVDIAEDNNKKSKGYGTVVFSTPMEALQAVSMFNGYVFGDRAIVARLDRDSSLSRYPGSSSGNSSAGLPLNSMNNQQSQSPQAGVNPMTMLQLQSLVALSALAGSGLGNLGGLAGASGLSGAASSSLGLGSQGGLGALGNTGLGALSGLGGLSNLLSSLGGNLGALGQGSGIGTGASGLSDSPGMTGIGSSPSSISKYGGSGSRDESGRQIFVRNLPWKTTWQELKDRFRHCGHVVRADIITDDRGRSKGCGTVLFEHSDQAQRAAAEMNGFKLEGRDIEVRMDRQ